MPADRPSPAQVERGRGRDAQHVQVVQRARQCGAERSSRYTPPTAASASAAAAFQRLHPQLVVQLELTDTVVDLLASGCDLAQRLGQVSRWNDIAG